MTKKVFISYSWGTKEHQDWVVNLAKRLMSDSVDVVLDRWSLKDGHDVFSFMESMVKSDDICRVLIICDKNYKEKADNRKGGVGTETQIITPEIYNNVKQEKFIPIVVERDETGNYYLPVYLKSRKYIDFSNEEFFEDSYEELLRNIFDVPSIPKPKLGDKPPQYITEPNINNTQTNAFLRTLENQLKKNPEKVNTYSLNFLEKFSEQLWEFELNAKFTNWDELGASIVKNLESYKVIKEDFIQFLLIVTLDYSDFDVDNLIEFFEKKLLFEKPREGSVNSSNHFFYNYKIIFHELFIYTIACCLKNKNYNLIGKLLNSKYHFKNDYFGKPLARTFSGIFNYDSNIMKYLDRKYKAEQGFRYIILSTLSNKIKKEDLLLADIICYVVSQIFPDDNSNDYWFPLLHNHWENGYDFFDKLSSERHFNRVKDIFRAKTPNGLRLNINKYISLKKERWYNGSLNSIPFVHELIPPERIAIYP